MGKIGAFLGVFLIPTILNTYGISRVFLFLAIVSFLGIISTQLIPEMSQRSIDHTEIVNKVFRLQRK
jgi:hypothetical protein